MQKPIFIILAIMLALTGGCTKENASRPKSGTEKKHAGKTMIGSEPERIEVQHILISFQGAIPGDSVARTMEEANRLAYELLKRARAGENFGALVKEYSDDQFPGIYRMSNAGIEPDLTKQEYSRDKMVKAFGDVGFSLGVGEIGIAAYDSTASKYGWHVIKRLK